jgi:hypothetical protein
MLRTIIVVNSTEPAFNYLTNCIEPMMEERQNMTMENLWIFLPKKRGSLHKLMGV